MQHRIRQQRLIVEIAGITPREAGQWHDRMERLHHRVIEPALASHFDRVAPSDRTLTLEQLTVTVNLDGHDSVEAAVEAGFAAALQRALPPGTLHPPSPAETFAVLLGFLRGGCLPFAVAGMRELQTRVATWMPRATTAEWQALYALARDAPATFFGRGAQVQSSFPRDCLRAFQRLALTDAEDTTLRTGAPLDAPLFTRLLTNPAARSDPDQATAARKPNPPARAPDASPDYSIANAGLILLHPYLAHLLREVDCRADGEAGRAAALFHYLVYKRCPEGEWELPLTKVLLGVPPEAYLVADRELTEPDRDAAEDLLSGVIAHWTALGSTRTDGLREGFLQRPGVLRATSGGYRLGVEGHAIDVLLDRIPWSISLVKTPWMPRPLQVSWR